MAGRHLLIWTVHRGTPLYQASGRGYLHSRGYALGGYSLSNPGPVTHGHRGPQVDYLIPSNNSNRRKISNASILFAPEYQYRVKHVTAYDSLPHFLPSRTSLSSSLSHAPTYSHILSLSLPSHSFARTHTALFLNGAAITLDNRGAAPGPIPASAPASEGFVLWRGWG